MNRYCSECERPLSDMYPECGLHPHAPVDETPGEPEEPLSEIDALEESAASPISYHLSEAARKVAALEARLLEVQLLARRADDTLSGFQRRVGTCPQIDEARAILTKALETL